ncbi:MAG: STAS domain-containing protein [Phycisphaerales bacterium]
MPINVWSDEIYIVHLSDEPAFSEDMAALKGTLAENGAENGTVVPDVIADLRDVSFLNSSNIAQLLAVRQALNTAGRNLRLCSLQHGVWSVLHVAGLGRVFHITDDVAMSLASLQLDEDADNEGDLE